jgi:hypothetical protein
VIGLDHQEAGIAAPQQLVVEPLAVDDDVREAAAVPVTSLDVVLELHRPSRQLLLGERGGLGAEALDRLGRVVRLGRNGLWSLSPIRVSCLANTCSPTVKVVPDLPIPELVENRRRSIAMLPVGAPTLNRDEALELLAQLEAAALTELRRLRAELEEP